MGSRLMLSLFLVWFGFEYVIVSCGKIVCHPELCEYVRCKQFEALCIYPGAKRIKNGSICGCCDKCVIVKRKGHQCVIFAEKFGSIDIECEAGTACNIMTLNCE